MNAKVFLNSEEGTQKFSYNEDINFGKKENVCFINRVTALFSVCVYILVSSFSPGVFYKTRFFVEHLFFQIHAANAAKAVRRSDF
jgi:hypothetical protein